MIQVTSLLAAAVIAGWSISGEGGTMKEGKVVIKQPSTFSWFAEGGLFKVTSGSKILIKAHKSRGTVTISPGTYVLVVKSAGPWTLTLKP
jgi:hypothetical protein